ncbi:MarR family winged helix-turn-helix transcriptional regulator [Denitrobaculum tricleocarpae]|uniref:MarR family transcriptional regulator n=1 Tax=Denitrobaculum tricleocarpae TaxID=2591009 RepID=A0A545TTQ9_9PROT|nr:MarR family transcriptional regulator [Denitrobaculum tricleocarpae]TQV80531.1 MarR family transcriptional regulator [Denitrobaculum tricleocarpae]
MAISPADAICQFIPPFLRFLRQGMAELDLSPARFQILQALSKGQARSMVDLAERLCVTKRNITTLVDGLEKDGLAARRPHPTDRRSTLVVLTQTGEAVFVEAARVQTESLTELLGNLEPAEREAMAQALTHLTDALALKLEN